MVTYGTVYVRDSQETTSTYDIEIMDCNERGSAALVRQSLPKDDVLLRLQQQFKLSAVDSKRFLAKPEATRALPNWPISEEVLADYGTLEDDLLDGALHNPDPDTSDYNNPDTFGTAAGEQLDKALNKK